MLEISIMDASVTILPFSYVVDIYVLRKKYFYILYVHILHTCIYIYTYGGHNENFVMGLYANNSFHNTFEF